MGEEASPVGSLATRASPTIGSSLIPIINKLQEIIAPVGDDLTGISLPEVAVVGSQSSGKSSVLEALVGHDFLPRGCNICTRRPLVLMLENRPVKPGDGGKEWGEFLHLPGKRFYDFSKIRREIQIETEREAGSNKAVSDKQIRLKICSPNVLNMTLVDLPGITKVPVGDQPGDIEARIRKMIMAHISQENCIILAVTPANSDLTNSDALQMAKEADPTGSRTIGVITKLDIMDRGTNACNFLLGNVVPLRLGYVGVVNRSQEDINKNHCIAEALSDEERFFRNHPAYSGLSDRCSIPQLARKLNQILEQHIRVVLPDLKARLNSQLKIAEQELQTCGQVIEPNGKGAILLNILSKYCEAFSAMVDGNSKDLSSKELSGGARIRYIFQSIFVKSLEEVDPCDDLTDDDIQIVIQNASGLRNAIFVPEVPFEVLVRRQIDRLLSPSLQCLQYAYQELKKISRACECEVTELQRFPVLRRRLGIIMDKFLCDGTKPAGEMINNLIAMEMDYVNSSHPNFLGGRKAIEQATTQQLRLPQRSTDVEDASLSEKSQNSRAFLARSPVTAVLPNQVREQLNSTYPNVYPKRFAVAMCLTTNKRASDGNRPTVTNEKPISSGGYKSTRTWGISSIFGSKASSVGSPSARFSAEEWNDLNFDLMPSEIQLREPPSLLRPEEMTQNETVEIVVIKLLLQSYYDIVRKNIQDLVPKAIMHFLVNRTKRELQKTFIQILYREDLFEELLQEESDVLLKRKRSKELLQVLKQAIQMLVEVEFDISCRSSPSSFDTDAATGLPKVPGFSFR